MCKHLPPGLLIRCESLLPNHKVKGIAVRGSHPVASIGNGIIGTWKKYWRDSSKSFGGSGSLRLGTQGVVAVFKTTL